MRPAHAGFSFACDTSHILHLLGIAQKTHPLRREPRKQTWEKGQEMADPKEPKDPTQDPTPEPEPEPTPEPKPGADPTPEPEPEPEPKDKYGQPGINKERHEKEVAELQKKIDELTAQVADAAEQKEKRADFEKQVSDLKAELADSKITHSLEMLGCKNVKAAKALLEDYGNDPSKLKEGEPYLFAEEEEHKPKGSTGKKPEGPASSLDEKLDKAFGLKK